MKGVPGLLLALALALAGALCNWFYMAQKSRELDIVHFIGVADGGLKAGDTIQSGQLTPVPIPRRFAERLVQAAPVYQDIATVVGTTAYRDFNAGEVILAQDLRTPPGNDLKRDLGPEEVALWISVDGRGFVPQFFSGGDEVSFVVVAGGGRRSAASADQLVAPPTEVIGPFYILALGNRRGTADRNRAAGQSGISENVVAIRVKRVNENQLEPRAEMLLSRLQLSNNQAQGLVLHSERKK